MKASEQIEVKTATERDAHQSRGQVTAGCAGVECVVMAVGQPIECHRRRASGRHADEDAQTNPGDDRAIRPARALPERPRARRTGAQTRCG